MLIWLLHLLTHCSIKVPQFFFYCTTRMLLSTISAFTMTICLGYPVIRMLCAWKIGHNVRIADCEMLSQQYTKSQDVPTMGGSLFITTIAINAILFMDWSSPFPHILLGTLIFLGCIGCIDDYSKLQGKKRGISPKEKLCAQLLLSAFVAWFLLYPHTLANILSTPVVKEHVGDHMQHISPEQFALRYYIPFFKHPIVLAGALGVILTFLMTLFVITGSINSVNLADGLDGLATGCVMLVAGVLAVVAFVSSHISISQYLNILYIEKSGEIAVFLCALMGASLGFLWYNGFPAQIFMGDTGSMALGGVIGVSSVLLKREFLLALVGGIFVCEALSVMLQVVSYKYRRKRIFLCAPLHHHFEMKGIPETKIVLRFWMMGLILALIGLLSLKLQ